jgi:hypothetical protein
MSFSQHTAKSVDEIGQFKIGQRICVNNVQACPPQLYAGEIVDLYDDNSARLNWDQRTLRNEEGIKFANLGRVDLHWATLL